MSLTKKEEESTRTLLPGSGKPDPHQADGATLFQRRRKSDALCLEKREGKKKGSRLRSCKKVYILQSNEPLYRETYVSLPFPVWTQEQQQKADQISVHRGSSSVY